MRLTGAPCMPRNRGTGPTRKRKPAAPKTEEAGDVQDGANAGAAGRGRGLYDVRAGLASRGSAIPRRSTASFPPALSRRAQRAPCSAHGWRRKNSPAVPKQPSGVARPYEQRGAVVTRRQWSRDDLRPRLAQSRSSPRVPTTKKVMRILIWAKRRPGRSSCFLALVPTILAT